MTPLTKDMIAMQKSWEKNGNKNALADLIGVIAAHIDKIEDRLRRLESATKRNTVR